MTGSKGTCAGMTPHRMNECPRGKNVIKSLLPVTPVQRSLGKSLRPQWDASGCQGPMNKPKLCAVSVVMGDSSELYFTDLSAQWL